MSSTVAEFLYYLKKEGLALRLRMGRQAILIHVALIGVFGILLPSWKGVDFLDPVMLSAYTCLGIVFAAPAAAQAFAQSRPESLSEALARIAIAVIYSETITLIMVAAGLIMVYSRTHFPVPPDLETLGMSAALGFAASIALAATAGLITLQFSATSARMALRIIFLALLLLFFYRSRWLPDIAGTGALLSLAIAASAILAIRRTLQTPRPN
jgi:hypothetical protein